MNSTKLYIFCRHNEKKRAVSFRSWLGWCLLSQIHLQVNQSLPIVLTFLENDKQIGGNQITMETWCEIVWTIIFFFVWIWMRRLKKKKNNWAVELLICIQQPNGEVDAKCTVNQGCVSVCRYFEVCFELDVLS